MYSLDFPDMFTNTHTNLVKDHDATWSNLRLLLLSNRRALFGDPYYGSSLQRLLYEQNNNVLKDIVIDDIYTTIITFMPQITLTRKDIDIIMDKETVYINIKCTNLLDFKTNTYTLNLMNLGE